ncbi:hypothetical protein LUZ60_009987 [Juncus effusus]|nr:hypothetical protein LUZ60_009987 [Juncus effusus]
MESISRISSKELPCAACRLLHRKCNKDCILAPHFPPDQPDKFASVHKVFGASNVVKMLQTLEEEQREDAVQSLVYESNARIKDPVYGCTTAISYLQSCIQQLQVQLKTTQDQILESHEQNIPLLKFLTEIPSIDSTMESSNFSVDGMVYDAFCNDNL